MDKFKRIPLHFPMDQVIDSLFSLKDLWDSRSNDFPFYTLGKSAYLDGDTQEYYKGAEILNPILMENFKPLYDKIASALSDTLGEQLFFRLKLALPAFHIFPADEKLLSVSGNWHTDYPHITLGLGDQNASAFTVPIMLPLNGGGMDIRDSFERYYEYNIGEMVLHDGKTLHRIANYERYKNGEYRITLQGHIIRDDQNNLIMFW
jgi:hypothetical protein